MFNSKRVQELEDEVKHLQDRIDRWEKKLYASQKIKVGDRFWPMLGDKRAEITFQRAIFLLARAMNMDFKANPEKPAFVTLEKIPKKT